MGTGDLVMIGDSVKELAVGMVSDLGEGLPGDVLASNVVGGNGLLCPQQFLYARMR